MNADQRKPVLAYKHAELGVTQSRLDATQSETGAPRQVSICRTHLIGLHLYELHKHDWFFIYLG